MSLTVARGTPIIEEPDRLGEDVEAVGVDETAFLRATGKHPTWFATKITDLTPGRAARCSTSPSAGCLGSCHRGRGPYTD
jgi:hypothetical protein